MYFPASVTIAQGAGRWPVGCLFYLLSLASAKPPTDYQAARRVRRDSADSAGFY